MVARIGHVHDAPRVGYALWLVELAGTISAPAKRDDHRFRAGNPGRRRHALDTRRSEPNAGVNLKHSLFGFMLSLYYAQSVKILNNRLFKIASAPLRNLTRESVQPNP